MKTKFLLPVVSACLLAWSAPSVLAASADSVVAANSAPMSVVLQNVQAQGGIISVWDIKLEDGAYRVNGVNNQGQKVIANVNPLTGNVVGTPTVKNPISMLQAVQAVESAGYKHIYSVTTAKGEYKIKAYDPKGSKTDLVVDTKTGKVEID